MVISLIEKCSKEKIRKVISVSMSQIFKSAESYLRSPYLSISLQHVVTVPFKTYFVLRLKGGSGFSQNRKAQQRFGVRKVHVNLRKVCYQNSPQIYQFLCFLKNRGTSGKCGPFQQSKKSSKELSSVSQTPMQELLHCSTQDLHNTMEWSSSVQVP